MWFVNVYKIIYIIITTTVCLALYKWAVHNNCMECFLTSRWDVQGMVKWVDPSVRKGENWQNVWYCTNELYFITVCKVFALPYRYTFPSLFPAPLFLYIPQFSTFSPCLTLWSIHFTIPCTSHLSVRKPSIQLLCTAHLYNAKHTVFVTRIYIILITFTDYISFLLPKTRDMIGQGSMTCENLGIVKWILTLFHSCW